MTEEQWHSSAFPLVMLHHLGERHSPRKLRLFSVACCLQIRHLIVDPRSRQAMEAAIRYAEGHITADALARSRAAAHDRWKEVADTNEENKPAGIRADHIAFWADSAAIYSADPKPVPSWVAEYAASASALAGSKLEYAGDAEEFYGTEFRSAQALAYRPLASLLRHLIGNPFKPYAAPASWPFTVVQLATSLYDGQDCRLPLSDALEESGHSELAEHFRKEEWHPKGCFAMDLILGKA